MAQIFQMNKIFRRLDLSGARYSPMFTLAVATPTRSLKCSCIIPAHIYSTMYHLYKIAFILKYTLFIVEECLRSNMAKDCSGSSCVLREFPHKVGARCILGGYKNLPENLYTLRVPPLAFKHAHTCWSTPVAKQTTAHHNLTCKQKYRYGNDCDHLTPEYNT
jgi:hypothetical protein